LQWVLDADIDECYDSFSHELMLEFVREEVDDPIVLRLIEQWLRVGCRDPAEARGIPMGAVISPLLCNLYLHRLDLGLTERGYALVRYADDFCAFCTKRAEAEAARQDTEQILGEIKLCLEPHKTAITHFDEGFDYLGVHFYGDTYSFVAAGKRIEVEGDFDSTLFYDYVPEGYQ
jgi:RNA-directed DNA polymerase